MRDTPDAVMMFAAGFGTRMKLLTQDRPKPMIPVAGKPLVDHALELALAVGPRQIVANLHYRPEILQDHLEARGVATVLETPDILETGGGLRNALPRLGDGPVYTMNTDAIWAGPNPLALLRAAWDPHDMDGLLMLVPREHAVGHSGSGDFIPDDGGKLRRGPGHIYGGIQIVRTEGLHRIDEAKFSLNKLWDMMLEDGRLYGIPYAGQWCDVGQPEGIELAERMLANTHV